MGSFFTRGLPHHTCGRLCHCLFLFLHRCSDCCILLVHRLVLCVLFPCTVSSRLGLHQQVFCLCAPSMYSQHPLEVRHELFCSFRIWSDPAWGCAINYSVRALQCASSCRTGLRHHLLCACSFGVKSTPAWCCAINCSVRALSVYRQHPSGAAPSIVLCMVFQWTVISRLGIRH